MTTESWIGAAPALRRFHATGDYASLALFALAERAARLRRVNPSVETGVAGDRPQPAAQRRRAPRKFR